MIMEIIVKKSKIHGKGVFADRNFKKGEIVIPHVFKDITKKEYEKLPREEKDCVGIMGKTHRLFLTPTKYVNHSCNPNTMATGDKDIAIRDIKKGEEITNYYEDEDSDFNMVCNCGSKNCRKLIKN